MPVLGESNLKKVVLPSSSKPSDEAWVMIDTELSVDLVIVSMGLNDDKSVKKSNKENATEGVEIMARVVKKWNFTNAAKEALPITAENFRKLPFIDLQTISNAVDIEGATKRAMLTVEKKRLSPDTSSPKVEGK